VYSTLLFPPYCSKLLLRGWRWTAILRQGVLGYVLPRLLFLWCLESSAVSFRLRVILVFKDIIYVIIILYSWQLVIGEHFLSVCVEQLILGIHTMSTWFWHKNQVWQWPAGQIPWLAGQVLCQFGLWFHAHVSTRKGEGQGGGESRWRPNHVADRPRD
jgi:hypothetical protein